MAYVVLDTPETSKPGGRIRLLMYVVSVALARR